MKYLVVRLNQLEDLQVIFKTSARFA